MNNGKWKMNTRANTIEVSVFPHYSLFILNC
jgi:hypothetical protein